MIEYETIIPSTHMLVSMRNTSAMTLAKAAAEITDNSLDAGATKVHISQADDSITFLDDGRGCLDRKALLGVGEHRAVASQGLGRYGVGLKDAASWLGETMCVTSRTSNGVIKGFAVWQEIIDSHEWQFGFEKDPSLLPIAPGPSFMKIEIGSVNKYKFRKWKDLPGHLANIFWPALEHGKQIFVDDVAVACPEPVQLLEEITAGGEFEGKTWSLRAGKLPSLSAPQGYTVTYKHRVLLSGYENSGFGDYTANHLYCLVTLHDGPGGEWKLSKWKDSVDGLDDLLESIYPTIEHLIKRTSETMHNVELRSMERQLEQLFNEGVIGHEKRGKGQQEGTVEPKDSGKKRHTAARVRPGDGHTQERDAGKFPISRIRVHLEDRGGDCLGHAYGDSKQMHVVIDLGHPIGKKAQKDLALSNYIVCSSVAAFAQLSPRQLSLPFDSAPEEVTGFEHYKINVNKWLQQTTPRLLKEVA